MIDWFGASKVADKAGKPLVVYHGTWRIFDSFAVFPAFFSNRPEIASDYAGLPISRYRHPNVLPVYLKINNPVVIRDNYQHSVFRRINSKRGNKQKAIQWLEGKGFDGVVFTDSLFGPNGTTQYIVFNKEQIRSVWSTI